MSLSKLIEAVVCLIRGHRYSRHGCDYNGKGGEMVCNRCYAPKPTILRAVEQEGRG